MSDQSVAQLDCVSQRFHCQRTLCDSGQTEEIRYRTERKDEMIVFKRVRVPIETVRDNDLFFVNVDLVHIAAEKVHAANHFADRIDDVGQIQIARRNFMQHWREQKKVLAIYDSDLETWVPAFFKLQRRIQPAETAAENQNTRFVAHRNRSKHTILQP